MEFEHEAYEKAVADLCASFKRKPSAAASLDGLNLSPVDTAKMMHAKLQELKQDELAISVKTALDALDPEMLRLPAYEREGPNGTPPGNRRGNRQRPPPGR